MEPLVDIVAVEVVASHRLRLTFEDGVVGDVDFSGRDWSGVLAPLGDPDYFSRVVVDSECGTIRWPEDDLDLAPEPLYEAALRNPSTTTA